MESLIKMKFTDNEKEFLKQVVKKELDNFEDEGETIIEAEPAFIALEEKYDEFLKNLLKKLQ